MIISKDQNTITLGCGTELIAKDDLDCQLCELRHFHRECPKAPCTSRARNDRQTVIFITKESANVQ